MADPLLAVILERRNPQQEHILNARFSDVFPPRLHARDLDSDMLPTRVKRVPDGSAPSSASTTTVSTSPACTSNQASNTCEKPTNISTTLPIALGITVPVVAILVFIYLHRQYKQRLRKEDRADAEKYKSMDFGMDLNYGGKKGKKGPGMTNDLDRSSSRHGPQLSLDPSTALFFPSANTAAHQSTDSLLDMDHRYRPVALASQDGMSSRSASPMLRGRTETMNSSSLRYDSSLGHHIPMRGDSMSPPHPPSKDGSPFGTPRAPKPALVKDTLGVPSPDGIARDSYFEKNASTFRKSNNYLAAFFGNPSNDIKEDKIDEKRSSSGDSVSHIHSVASTTIDSPTNKTPVTSISDVDSLPAIPTRKNSLRLGDPPIHQNGERKIARLSEQPRSIEPVEPMVFNVTAEDTAFTNPRAVPPPTPKMADHAFTNPRAPPTPTFKNKEFANEDGFNFPLPGGPRENHFANSMMSDVSNLTDILNTPRDSTTVSALKPNKQQQSPFKAREDSLTGPLSSDEQGSSMAHEPLRFTDHPVELEPLRFTDDLQPEPLRFTNTPDHHRQEHQYDQRQSMGEPLNFSDDQRYQNHEHVAQHEEDHDIMDIADAYNEEEFDNVMHGDDGHIMVDHRLSILMRPLPPDNPDEPPEDRANRIRSFYKEYFDPNDYQQQQQQPQQGSNGEPPMQPQQPIPRPVQNSRAAYYEDYGSEYLNNGGTVYDSETQGFVVSARPFAEPVTRRAMTPPPRGPPRFHGPPSSGMATPRGGHSRAGSMATPRGGHSRAGSMANSAFGHPRLPGPPFRGPGGYPPRGPSQMSNRGGPPMPHGPYHPRGASQMSINGPFPPRGPSQMSNYSRSGTGMGHRIKKPGPPPQPLTSLPTPHLLKDDTAIFGAADFAPPISFRERQNGRRPDSPMGMQRPYGPAVKAFVPLASSFDDLGAVPSPHMLDKSVGYTNLDFAPPRRFKNEGDAGSDAMSIRSGRSNRSGISAAANYNIRAGAYRMSRVPKQLVGTKTDIVQGLKPTWDLRGPA